ncbi:hypothetical protein K8R42_01405, partial [bacterium]|nr:hypothetical protein [bacterium]
MANIPIILDGTDHHSLDEDTDLICKEGKEAEIYKLSDEYAVKIYRDNVIDKTPEQGFNTRMKLLALCSSFSDNVSHFNRNVAFPQKLLYKWCKEFDCIFGFSMNYFKECYDMGRMSYDPRISDFKSPASYKFDDNKAVDFIYKLFTIIDLLHSKLGIIIGDVNLTNILCSDHHNSPI